jgi:serine/threonine-protein phosphatase 2A regulatory subunit B
MESNNEQSNFFTQMISSYSSLVFLNNNKQIAARDFLSVKVWDLAKTDKPIFSLPIQKAMKSKLCEIFENDSIFDKFNISSSKDSHTLLTGSYSNCFHAIDVNDSTNSQY